MVSCITKILMKKTKAEPAICSREAPPLFQGVMRQGMTALGCVSIRRGIPEGHLLPLLSQ